MKPLRKKGFTYMEMTMDYLNKLDLNKLPIHIGIIMDGNGRWATKRGLPRTLGHKAGMKKVVEVVKAAYEAGIKYLTLYAFSTENWKRPELEIKGLMDLLVMYVNNELSELKKNNIKINILGDFYAFPKAVVNSLKQAVSETNNNDGMVLNIALNYGGREDIVQAVKKIIEADIKADEITEKTISNFLYTKNQPDVDFILRPSGEMRLSNFLLFQGAYAELYFTNTLWPDFSKDDFFKALYEYQNRERRFGGI